MRFKKTEESLVAAPFSLNKVSSSTNVCLENFTQYTEQEIL